MARWQFWSVAHFAPAMRPFIDENMFKSIQGQGDADPRVLASALPTFEQLARVLNRHLEHRAFLVGSSPTLADYSVSSFLVYAEPGRMPVGDFGRVAGWARRIHQLPEWPRPLR